MNARSSLKELNIRNIGVIVETDLEFGPGLTVLTGETGAGKTMVLTALNLILGAKSDVDLVRKGADRLTASGTFGITSSVAEQIQNNGGIVESGEVIISRSVTNEGKSKISLGGIPSTTTQVAALSNFLIEVHAQSSSARLAKSSVQRDLLDAFAGLSSDLSDYQEAFESYNLLAKRIKELESEMSKRDSEIERITAFVKDFEKVTPLTDELADIENDIAKLGSVEEINNSMSLALTAIVDDENSALNSLQVARKALDGLRKYGSELSDLVESYNDAIFEVSEVSAALSRFLANLEADPNRFDYLRNRRAEIISLIKRYGKGETQIEGFKSLFVLFDSAKTKLLDLAGGDERVAALKEDLAKAFTLMQKSALKISKERAVSAEKLSHLITTELHSLSMPSATILISVERADESEIKSYSASGLDEVKFLFTSHKGGAMLAITKSASGGELSRVMLALEVVLAELSPVGTYIFDEVDSGVGGKAAVEVGRRLAKLAQQSQVIVVTHLAQVAVWANQHFVVQKSEDGSVTQSDVIAVTGALRTKEIARLLSGQEDSKTAQEHATELLDLVAKSMIS